MRVRDEPRVSLPRVAFPVLALLLLLLSLLAPTAVNYATHEPRPVAAPGLTATRLAVARTMRGLLPAASSAVPPVAWQDVSSTVGTPPSARVGAAMTYDAADGYVLLFGGEDPGGTLFHDDTWKFSGGVWTNITASAGTPPPARVSASMTYDAADGYVVMFGGLAVTGGGYWLEDYPDTWKFSGGVWSNITATAGTAPSGRFSMGLAYDWGDHEVLGFGGEDAAINGLIGSVTMYGGTWAFSGGTWRSLSGSVSTPPSSRAGPNMAYDPADGYLLLYGGIWETLSGTTLSGREMADTWSFAGGTWSNLTASVTGSPGELALSGFAYDTNARTVIMFGGCTPPISQTCPVSNSTWSFVARTWTNVTPWITQAPAPRASMAMTNDSADGDLLLFAGSCGSGCATSDTWTENDHGSNVYPLTFLASPSSCGPVVFDGTPWAAGSSGSFTAGPGTLSVAPCTGHRFAGWNVSGGLGVASPSSASSTTDLWGSASVTAWFVPTLSVQSSATSPTVGLGASDTLTATAYGGLGPYGTEWALNGTNTSVKLDPYTLTFAHAATYSYTVWATDALGSVAESAATTVRVLPYTPPPLVLNLSLTSYYAPTGSTLTGTATATGGTIQTYLWTENGTQTVPPCSTSSCAFPFPHGGTYVVAVTVTDSLGRSASSSTNITIWTRFASGPPPPLTAVLVANTTTLFVGEPMTLNVTPSGGIPPYHGYVLWVNGTGNSSPVSTRQFQYSFTGAATYQVQLWVYDSAGNVAASNMLTVTVKPAPQSTSGGTGALGFTLFGLPGILVLALLVGLVVVVVAVVVLMRRPKRPTPEEDAAATAPYPYGYAGGGGMDPAYGGGGAYPYGQGGGPYDVPAGPPQGSGPYARGR